MSGLQRMIYFAEVRINRKRLIKIGCTHHLETRIRRHTPCFDSIRLLAVMPGWRREERAVLKRFAHLRVPYSYFTELFRPDIQLLDWISANASEPPPGRYVPRRYDMTNRMSMWRGQMGMTCSGPRIDGSVHE